MISKKKKIPTRLFQSTIFTKMLCGPLQNGPVAHRWAMAHRLKSNGLEDETPNHHVGNCKLYHDIRVKYLVTKDGTTSVPYFSSIFEAYQTNVPYPYHCKKGIPYQRTIAYFRAKIEAYRTYRTILPSLLKTTRNLN